MESAFIVYADDSQLYMSFSIGDKDETIFKLKQCIAEIWQLMANNFLRLNGVTTEVFEVQSICVINVRIRLSVWDLR